MRDEKLQTSEMKNQGREQNAKEDYGTGISAKGKVQSTLSGSQREAIKIIQELSRVAGSWNC